MDAGEQQVLFGQCNELAVRWVPVTAFELLT